MFDSPIEWLIIIVVILLLFGSTRKIPEFARNLGKATGEFKRGQLELENEMRKVMNPGINQTPTEKSPDFTEVARGLGIDTANKSQEQLSKEIAEKLKLNH